MYLFVYQLFQSGNTHAHWHGGAWFSASPTSRLAEPWEEMSCSSGQSTGVPAVPPTPNQPGLANLFSFPGFSLSLHSQGICPEISSELGPIRWSYVPASKVEEERSKVFVEIQNQLEFALNSIPVLSVISVSACMESCVWGRRISTLSFSKQKN